MAKLNLGVLFGGPSPEHEVSKASAINIFNNLDERNYNVIPIYIAKSGQWYLYDGNIHKLPPQERMEKYCAEVVLGKQGLLRIVGDKVRIMNLDVVFPMLHGAYGEDGVVQGLLEANDLPYVGCGIFASAACMDKIHTKAVAMAAGIPTVPHMALSQADLAEPDTLVKTIRATLGYPVFIKPANTGSSVGISKAKNKKEVLEALTQAFSFAPKVLVEKFVKAREIEVAVLGTGGEDTVASLPGEISQTNTFYTYDAKYNDPTSKNIIPAKIEDTTAEQAREWALKIFKAVGGSGLARVDFFLEDKTNTLVLNEVNTMPGFTDISMYPQLVNHMGMSYAQLLDNLIKIAVLTHAGVTDEPTVSEITEAAIPELTPSETTNEEAGEPASTKEE